MFENSINKQEYHLYRHRFLAWARRQWPVFSEADYEDIYHEALMKYIINAGEGKIRKDLDPLMLIRGFGQDDFRKRWRALRKAWKKVIPMEQLSQKTDQDQETGDVDPDPDTSPLIPGNPGIFDPEEGYDALLRIAKKAFNELDEAQQDLLSAKVIHHMAWEDMVKEEEEINPTRDQAAGKDKEEERRHNQRLRKRKEKALKILRENYYRLLDASTDPAES